jgi:hypothetical protein
MIAVRPDHQRQPSLHDMRAELSGIHLEMKAMHYEFMQLHDEHGERANTVSDNMKRTFKTIEGEEQRIQRYMHELLKGAGIEALRNPYQLWNIVASHRKLRDMRAKALDRMRRLLGEKEKQ